MKNRFYRSIGLSVFIGILIYFASVCFKLLFLAQGINVDFSSYPPVIDSLIPPKYRKEINFVQSARYETFGVIFKFKDKHGEVINIIQLKGKLGQIKKKVNAVKTADDYGYFMDTFSLVGYETHFMVERLRQMAVNDFDLQTDATEINTLKDDDKTKSYLISRPDYMQLSLNSKPLFHLNKKVGSRDRSVQLVLKENSNFTYIILKVMREEK